MSPQVWGEMTLSEFMEAIQGFNELEEQRLKWQFYTTRKICLYIGKSVGANDLKEEDIIPIKDFDEQIEKMRRESLPVIQVQNDGPQ